MLTLMGIATAETCYTAISVPQADKYYWKAVTYSGINDGNYADYLTKAGTLIAPTGLGTGYQYTVRIDADCFDHYILSNLYTTGITSDQINIQKKDQDPQNAKRKQTQKQNNNHRAQVVPPYHRKGNDNISKRYTCSRVQHAFQAA